jgi:hypothetical protein
MMKTKINLKRLTSTQERFIFISGITIIYLFVLYWLDFLQGPIWWDEGPFWESSLVFSDDLLPSLDELKNYNNLNTPLPFILFGALEYLFGGGMFAGRLLNFCLSLGIVLIIGWPTKEKRGRAILCVIGLFLCPYFLWLSGRLYTEMVACTFGLLGMVAYVRERHFWSSIAFILAISSRQYMIAFPAAIAAYEFIATVQTYREHRSLDLSRQWRWIVPSIAMFSFLGWVLIFQGLAPESAIIGKAPEVQKSFFALEPGVAINFLTYVGAYIVIPELILFPPQTPLQTFKQHWKKWLIVAVGLLIFCLIFPPPVKGNGNMVKLAELLPAYWLQFMLFYSFALLAAIRFSKPDLLFWMVLFNALIMMKAIPWDRYVLPLVIMFWYLKSINVTAPGPIDQKT